MDKQEYNSVDEYIGTFPEKVQKLLNEMREIIRGQAPQAQEKISYQMPCYYLKGNLVYFGAHSRHIGFYPTASGIEAFKDEFEKRNFSYSKGAVQFSIDEPLPVDLIKRIVNFRLEENIKKK